jgi:hypothetical protein
MLSSALEWAQVESSDHTIFYFPSHTYFEC